MMLEKQELHVFHAVVALKGKICTMFWPKDPYQTAAAHVRKLRIHAKRKIDGQREKNSHHAEGKA